MRYNKCICGNCNAVFMSAESLEHHQEFNCKKSFRCYKKPKRKQADKSTFGFSVDTDKLFKNMNKILK